MTAPAVWMIDMREDRRQLLMIAMGSGSAGAVWFWLFRGRVASAVLVTLALFALAGFTAYPWVGRGVLLVFTLAARALGWALSELALVALYAIAIVGIGGLIRLFGVNRLERDFTACRTRATMLVDVPPLTAAGFRRQS